MIRLKSLCAVVNFAQQDFGGTCNASDLKYRAVEVECGGIYPIRRAAPLCFYNNCNSFL
jgi:hypothetical protein